MPTKAAAAPTSSPQPYIVNVAPKGRRTETASFDANYIERLVARDPETGRHFAKYFGELLWMKLRSRVQCPEMAEDISQETLVRVLAKLRNGELKKPECLGAFVSSFANNIMKEHFRGESKYCEIADEGCAMIDPKGSVHDSFLSDERKEQVRTVLNELSARDRDLLKAVFLDEQNKDQVCRQFGVNRAYLRVRLLRAREKFRAVFSETYRTTSNRNETLPHLRSQPVGDENGPRQSHKTSGA